MKSSTHKRTAVALAALVALLCPLPSPIEGGSVWEEDSTRGFPEGTMYRTELQPSDGGLALARDMIPGSGGDWALLHSGHPLPRTAAAMAWDLWSGESVLFGGNGAGGGVFTYNSTLNSWMSHQSGADPPGRYGHAMAADPGRGLVVVFGGLVGSVYSNETLVYNATARSWRRQSPPESPPGRYAHGMVYDARSGLFVLFGGWDSTYASRNDTWVYDLGNDTWHQRHPPKSPPGRAMHSMAYDSANGLVVLYGGLGRGDTWTYDPAADVWVERAPALPPSPRSGAAMVFDERRAISILFGGYGSGTFWSETWAYDAALDQWTNLHPSIAPPGRNCHCMAFDGRSGEAVLFGGVGGVGLTPPFGDTWAYNSSLNLWVPRVPTARWGHAMALDRARGVVVVFGGRDNVDNYKDDTWVFDPVKKMWRASLTAIRPPARQFGAMVYDERIQRCVLFGGYYPPMNDTWLYDVANDTWTRRTPPLSPPARFQHAMAYDPGAGLTVLFGGSGLSGRLGDTWVFSGTEGTWTQLSPADSPTARLGHAMAYDCERGAVLLQGGNDTSYLSDVWAYDSRAAAWSALEVSGGPPPARMGHSMAFDEARHATLLVGGRNESGALGDAWWLDSDGGRSVWRPVAASSPQPPPRYFAGAAYAPSVRASLVFGGYRGSELGELWTYPASTEFWREGWLTSRPLDTGGAASFGALLWSCLAPPGTSVSLQLRSAPGLEELLSASFVGPDGSEGSEYTESGARVWGGHNGSRWVQYRAILRTGDGSATPLLSSVSLEYNLLHSLALLAPVGGEAWWGEREIEWSALDPDGDALSFDIYLSTDSGATYPIELATGLTGSSLLWNASSIAGPSDLGMCRIKVVARDDNRAIPLSAEASSSEDFTALRWNEPPVAELLSPPNGSRVRSSSVALRWSSRDPDGDALLHHVILDGEEVCATGETSCEASGLSEGRHLWTVVPSDGRVNGSCSSGVWEFTVRPNAPPAATLLAPPPGARFRTGEVELSWAGEDADGDALSYYILVNGAAVALTTSTSHTLKGLTSGSYRWSVVPFDGFENGSCASGAWELSVLLNRPPIVSPVSPLSGSVLNTTRVELVWRGTDLDSDPLVFTVHVSDSEELNTSLTTRETSLALDLEDRRSYIWWLEASDGLDSTASEPLRFSIRVNHRPSILSSPPPSARPGTTYRYRVVAVDPDGDPLSFSLLEAPEGMVLSADGNLTWRPLGSQEGGTFSVLLSASDGELEDRQAFTVRALTVEGVRTDPGPLPGIALLATAVALALVAVLRRLRR
ncbi:MAG: Kelch repeat-containing protein [Thermoplasmatota archaeon]